MPTPLWRYRHCMLKLQQITPSNGKSYQLLLMKMQVWMQTVSIITNRIFIAATNWLFNHEQLLHIVSRAKALLPQCCVVMGGPEFLGDNEAFLRKNPFVSCVFRGEGEEVFPQWLECWNQPENWNTIAGLCYLDKEGGYRDNGIARVMEFANLISPEQSRFFNWSKPFVQLETTRGCFNTCAFCVSGGEKPGTDTLYRGHP